VQLRLIFIPCLYFVVRKDQSTDWVGHAELTEAHAVQLVKDFEERFSRSEGLPCNLVALDQCGGYKRILAGEKLSCKIQNLEDGASDDDLDLVARKTVDEYFGAPA
jgi:hypothetical protein